MYREVASRVLTVVYKEAAPAKNFFNDAGANRFSPDDT
jgi:hypothetical protein